MNLIDEQQLVGLEIHQQPHDVAGALQGWRTGDAAAHPQLFGQSQILLPGDAADFDGSHE